MKKKLLSLFLVLLMVLSFNFTYSQELTSSFPDVSTDSMNLKAIEHLKEKGYMIGYDDGTFKPEKIVTRAEFIKILIEKDGGIASVPDGITTGFSDVDTPVPHWAQKYIYLGVKKGYLLGMGDGTFAPDATITYEQAIKILVCHLGKEDAAKAKASGYLPLWPNAYVVTGEQLELNKDTGLKIGDSVKRAFVAQMVFNSIDVVRPGNNMIIPSNDGGTSGNGPTEEISYSKITGIIVSTPGVCIDVNTTSIKEDEPYIKIKYTNTSGEAVYSVLREPIPSSGDKSARNPYKDYLGCEVNIKYYKSDYKDSSGNKINVVSSLSLNSSTKTLKLSAEDIIVDESNAADGIYYYKNGKKQNNPIVLPANLDDMAVVYNGVPIDSLHPSYDRDWANDTTYVKFSDLIPERGSVTFVNRGSGPVEVAIVTSYDTVVAKRAASSMNSRAVDKYDESKIYILDETKLLEYLNNHYTGHRTLTAEDVSVTMSKSVKGNVTKYEEVKISEISKESVLTVYASKDLSKIDFILCKDKTSTAGSKVTTGFDKDSREVALDNTIYKVSDYMINHISDNANIDSVNEVFPLKQRVVAYLDTFGEIVDVLLKDPDYTYGYLVDVDYKKGSSAENSYMNLHIITSANVSKYETPEEQTFEISSTGKFTLNGVNYTYENYRDVAAKLEANAWYINYGDGSDNVPKNDYMIKNADYAQPVRFIVSDTNSKVIKNLVTIQPIKRFTKNSSSYFCTTAGKLGSEYSLDTNGTVVFKVPDDRFEYEKYEVKKRTDGITANTSHNAEVYQETKDGELYDNCVVLYNESITARPSITSKLAIVKTVAYKDTVDDEDYYEIVLYMPTSQTSGSYLSYYIKSDELMADNTTVSPATETKVDIGDVIVFGTDKQIELAGDTIGKTLIRNLSMVVDVSNRDKEGFNVKYKQNGEAATGDNPYYWYRYGTVVSFSSAKDELVLDVGEDEFLEISGTNLFNREVSKRAKPVYFYEDEYGKAAVGQGAGTRFVDIDDDGTVTISDMLQEGDKLLIYTKQTSSTATPTHLTVYLVPKADLDELYPDNTTYTDVTFLVENEGAVVSMSGMTATVTDGIAVFRNVPNGYYDYEISLYGYITEKGSVVVRKNTPELEVSDEGSPIILSNYTSSVKFIVEPGNALIDFAGELKTGSGDEDRTSTVTFTGISVGTYEYNIYAEGYYSKTGEITVIQGETPVVEVQLVPVTTE